MRLINRGSMHSIIMLHYLFRRSLFIIGMAVGLPIPLPDADCFFLNMIQQIRFYLNIHTCTDFLFSLSKVVRTFFRTNRSTCQEWLLRIRLCVMIIAEHCGESAVVVRQAWELMRDMQNSGNTQVGEVV